jgi:protein-tyrosine-phosphatase/DNA-binding transcriptional ArsR family regulator
MAPILAELAGLNQYGLMYFRFVSESRTDPAEASLEFLRLAGEPVRWQLLRELARSDRHVRELTDLVGRPQNLVSYHLGKLRSAGLVVARRSSADGRDAYYTVALDRFAELLAAAGRSLHPGLQLPPAGPAAEPLGRPVRLLFLCTGNSARSQIAEALAVARSAGLAEAFSAGSHPKPVHPHAARVLRERGVGFGDRRSKHLSAFVAARFDYVITLCDKVREVCPEFPGHPGHIHWSIPDPAASGRDDQAILAAFREVAGDLDTRVSYLLAGIGARPDRAA